MEANRQLVPCQYQSNVGQQYRPQQYYTQKALILPKQVVNGYNSNKKIQWVVSNRKELDDSNTNNSNNNINSSNSVSSNSTSSINNSKDKKFELQWQVSSLKNQANQDSIQWFKKENNEQLSEGWGQSLSWNSKSFNGQNSDEQYLNIDNKKNHKDWSQNLNQNRKQSQNQEESEQFRKRSSQKSRELESQQLSWGHQLFSDQEANYKGYKGSDKQIGREDNQSIEERTQELLFGTQQQDGLQSNKQTKMLNFFQNNEEKEQQQQQSSKSREDQIMEMVEMLMEPVTSQTEVVNSGGSLDGESEDGDVDLEALIPTPLIVTPSQSVLRFGTWQEKQGVGSNSRKQKQFTDTDWISDGFVTEVSRKNDSSELTDVGLEYHVRLGEEEALQKDLICPITTDVFFVPVIAEDGITYEKSAILEWFQKSGGVSPITQSKIGQQLHVDRVKEKQAKAWRAKWT
eukprot:TRINITY_DN4481_c0_g1_i9.p1 TRINITY_DN4481_c0_g1~~TRINITY_DN4481_c0_g1_i9.p1  ORF type:complete len:505 (+),score=92.36 TRINITY_DN4481_c0_g1_i9:143-1516(+)